ncbi:MAG: hypothetical protein A2W93_12125 [Bacteroidetes bacterium GWF2_43_63]|nr:MAG: hypothetical protein A2W94_15615 [Bacteroidetes bacterium GWE2_42_42]OFY56369.1 MAG: hypothetical protein A2W93_12125 [Bacteroidetes bacterium GWF2_43_63]HBG69665.1 hypothetical protein [Bacteroidales bacterium]HCB61932.1 hypothetical protein [Bacteroidales bacterium]HCY42289.1 hypothetical protein [Prolixibacteraceae bacterium]
MAAKKENTKKAPGETRAEQALDYVMQHPGRVLVGGAVIGLSGLILYKIGKNMIAKAQQKNTEMKLDDSPEVRQAAVIHDALNPSGISILKSFDSTNTDKIYDAAKNMTNFDEVVKSYNKMYGGDLIAELQNELSADEYQKLMTLISTIPGKSGAPAVTFAKKNQMVVAKKEVYVRKTPDASYHEAWYESSKGNNILFQAKPGDFIGYATGKQELDLKNNVKFIQVGYIVKKEGLPAAFKAYAGKSYTMWIASSKDYVDVFDYFKQMFLQYPNTKTVVTFKKPLDYYDTTVKGFTTKMVVSTSDTKILNEKMQPYCTVERFVLLGEFLGSLVQGKTNYIKFLTVDNTERWVDSRTVKIIAQ